MGKDHVKMGEKEKKTSVENCPFEPRIELGLWTVHLDLKHLMCCSKTCTLWCYSNCSAVILGALLRSTPAACKKGTVIR